ncbi:MAG TPA: hypothetical protein VFS43_20855 [Polyangiaceae bacterium]|nr:hypothetical protein [Polyangiaceae bacterium]
MATSSKPSHTPEQNLADLALFIAHHVSNAMEASYVMYVADAWFHQFDEEQRRARFRTNPANTLHHRALSALEERSVVSIAETLKDPNRLFPVSSVIRRQSDLYLHRHALSHPMNLTWRDPSMQAFAQAKRPDGDWRPALVWDLQRSINDELREHGLKTYNETIAVHYEMALMLHGILELARRPECEIPSARELLEGLEHKLPDFVELLEARPDGQVRAKRESGAPEGGTPAGS